MANNIKGLTVEIGGNATKLIDALNDVNKKSRSLSSELGEVNRLLKLDPGNTDLLVQKQKILAEAVQTTKEKLDKLKEAEKQVQKQFERGEVSEEQVRALQREIIATEKKMEQYERAIEETNDALKGMDDSTEEVEESSGKLGETLANVAKTGFTAVATAAAALVTGLVAAAESTRDYRTEMGKLDVAFTTNGHTSEAALGAYKELQGILGETDQAVEAANHLAVLTKNEQDLAVWTGDILPGIFATFGASLPLEGLTEAANETAKVGQVTGGLADALNWASEQGMDFGIGLKENIDFTKKSAKELKNMSAAQREEYEARKAQYEEINKYNKSVEEAASVEDRFNIALANCTTEQERQALIMDTLQQIYGEASEVYKETNAEVIRANEANEAWMESMAGVGGAIEPIVTDIKLMGASLLSEAVPGVEALAGAFRGLLNGEDGAAADFGAAVSDLVSGLISKITEALPTIAQTGMSIISAIVTAIGQQLPTVLSTGGQILYQLLSGIVSNLPSIAQGAMDAIGGFVQGLQTNLPLVLEKGRELLLNLANGIRENLPSLVSQALDILTNFAQTIYDNAPTLVQTGFEVLSNIIAGILSALPELIARVPEIISTFANTINDNFPTILLKGAQLIWQIIQGIISAIPTLIANVPKIITAIVDVWEAFNWLNLGKKAITLLKDGVLKMVSSVKSAGKTIATTVTDTLKDLPSKLLNLGKSAISDLGGSIKNGVGSITSAAKSIFTAIVNAVKSLPGEMLSIGKNLVQGIWNGISGMSGWLSSQVWSFCSSVLSSIKSFFKIKSPSQVLRDDVGAMLAEGMAVGIEENADAPIDAMTDLSNGLLDEAEGLDGLTLERKLNNTFTAPAAAAASSAGMLDKLDRILAALERGQVLTIDGKALIGATADGYDAEMGRRRALVARGVM
jgi:phage-related minor tail protein